VTPQGSGAPHKLWGGRFAGGPAPSFDALNNSIGIDFRLWPFDITLSKAWAVALWNASVLTLEESQTLERGLDGVAARFNAGAVPIPSDEDIHTMIDRLLHDEVGDVASKLHTGRSRNDQVATATRLWTMDAVPRVDSAVRELQRVILDRADEVELVLMPAYTHLQRAQPVTAAHWLLSHFWPLERDRIRLRAAARTTAVLPLGSGAVAGSAYPVSRTLLQGTLGFDAVAANSMDAVSDRDFVAEVLFACTILIIHLSRFAEDLIIYGTSEFGFVQFGERFSSGSSMMPQKRNPDVLEITRGSAARLMGDLVALFTALKGLPSTYNKDLQDDKRALFDAVDTTLLVLPAFAGSLSEVKFRPDRMRAALSSGLMATDLADYLVHRGATFRESHAAVGQLVREAERLGVELDALSQTSFEAAHHLFGSDAKAALSAERSLKQRDLVGGTGPNAVKAQLQAARMAIQ
jgi:argininosuccinate lyase